MNQQLFRGFAITAAVREGRIEIIELLVRSGASQVACEDALLEACCHNRPKITELLMDSEQIRDQIATHALVLACARGFVEVAEVLMKKARIKLFLTRFNQMLTYYNFPFFHSCTFFPLSSLFQYNVDANGMARILLRSLKPTLHTNVDCTPLVAAIVSRQALVVRRLLQVIFSTIRV